jgi:hypothetical protein
MATSDKNRLTFFFPNARALSAGEVASLPDDKRKSAEAAGKLGVWLEVPCPDGSCLDKDGNVTLQAAGIEGKQDKGLWLNVFCPEDSCLWKGGTDLP